MKIYLDNDVYGHEVVGQDKRVALSTVPYSTAVPSNVNTGIAFGLPYNVMKGLFLSIVTFSCIHRDLT